MEAADTLSLWKPFLPEAPMPDERLIDLLERWKDREARGEAVDAASLCDGRPELRPELERLHRFEGGLVRLIGSLDDMPTVASPDTLVPPDLGLPAVPGYAVRTLLASGGMGEVYRAHDEGLGREVALKVIRPEKLSAALLARFRTEARAVAALDHPHIVQIYEVGEYPTAEGAVAPYLAMEYVPGGTLEAHARKPMAPADAARIVRMLARAMAHAHSRGVVHRDIKPANVLIAPPADEPSLDASIGRPKITDFGLARQEGGEGRLTRDGMLMGTPAYMAPEQADGRPDVGPPADVYALGVILYQLLSGRRPFDSPSLSKLLHQIAHEPPPPLEGVPEELGRICAACLEKGPPGRPSATELAASLEAWLSRDETSPPSPRKARPPRGRMAWIGAGAFIVAVLAIMAWRPWRASDDEKAAPQPTALAVKSLWLECFRVEGGKRYKFGTVSGVLREDPKYTLPFATRVFVHAEFTAPAHVFLIAFNADGTQKLLWPVNGNKLSDGTVPPPKVERVKYPDRTGAKGLTVLISLDEEKRGGLQAFAVVLSREPLPPYDEWRKGRDLSAWKRMAGFTDPFVADPKGVYPVVRGKGVVRGDEEFGEGPALLPLVAELKRGVDGVEMLAVPVEAKP